MNATEPLAYTKDRSLMLELSKWAKPVALSSDRMLFRQGDAPSSVFLVKKGIVLLRMLKERRILMEATAGEGAVLGLPAVLSGASYTLAAEAMPGAEIEAVSREEFPDHLVQDPDLAMRALLVLADEVRMARRWLAEC